jgi:hypothetical protein
MIYIFYFLKFIFEINTSKRSENIKKKYFLAKFFFEFFRNTGQPAFPNGAKTQFQNLDIWQTLNYFTRKKNIIFYE